MPMPILPVIDGAEVETLVAQQPIVLLHFRADWNLHDREMDRLLAALVDDREPGIMIGAVDVDMSPEVARRHGIVSLPTLVGYVHGRQTRLVVGLRPETQIRRIVEELRDKAAGRTVRWWRRWLRSGRAVR